MGVSYTPRNDYVVYRSEKVVVPDGGVVLPDVALGSHRYTVVAVGPKVEHLKEGDEILVIGKLGEDSAQLPREKDLFMTKESNVALVVTRGE